MNRFGSSIGLEARCLVPRGERRHELAEVTFDDACSSTSTLVQVIAQDRPGLLHRICSSFSYQECNIEIALIDTEGQMAIDAFYLTSQGSKLRPEHQKEIEKELVEELREE